MPFCGLQALEKYVCWLKWMSTLCLSLTSIPCYSFFIVCLGFPLFMRVLNSQAHIFPDWLAYMKWKIYRYRNVLGNANTFWAEMGWRPFLQWALIKIKLDHKARICRSFCLVTCRHFTEFFFSPSLLLLYIKTKQNKNAALAPHPEMKRWEGGPEPWLSIAWLAKMG